MRIGFGIPFLIVAIVVLYPALILLAVLRSIIMIPLGIALGREISKNDEPVGRVLWGVWMWTTDNTRWVLTGSVGPKIIPTIHRP